MRTGASSKRELAISAALIDAAAAQVRSEAEHECVPAKEAAALEIYARGLRGVAESLFLKSQPRPRTRA